jgi:hypothetical protein
MGEGWDGRLRGHPWARNEGNAVACLEQSRPRSQWSGVNVKMLDRSGVCCTAICNYWLDGYK